VRPELDPDFALQSRLSFGRGARYAWVLTAIAVFLGFDGTFGGTTALALVRGGSFLLLAALPYGAIQVRALERSGHLDARRLTGRSPVAMGLALIGGSAWALLLAGAALLATGWAAGQTPPAITLAALLALGLATALVFLLMSGSMNVDSSMLLALLALGVFSSVHVIGSDRTIALSVLIVSALICPWALPLALRRMRGAPPQPAAPAGRQSLLRRIVYLQRTGHSEFARGILSAGATLSAAAALAIAGALTLRWMARNMKPDPRNAFEAFVVYAPLVLAGYDTAVRMQHERVSGTLDQIRLSGQAGWRVVLDYAVAFSLPFAAVSLVCAAALAVFDPVHAWPILAAWPFIAGMLIVAPLAGTFRGLSPGLSVAAAIPLFWLIIAADEGWLPVLFAASAIGLIAADGLERADQAPLRGKAAVAGIGMIAATAVVVAPLAVGPVVAGLLALFSSLLVPDRSPLRNRTVFASAIAAAAAAGVATYFWVEDSPDARFALYVRLTPLLSGVVRVWDAPGPRGVYSVLVAAYAGAGLLYGYFAHNRFGRTNKRSLAWRSVPLALVPAGVIAYSVGPAAQTLYDFAVRTGYNGFAFVELALLGCLLGVTGILGWRERNALQRG
jgi:hypothetical protein